MICDVDHIRISLHLVLISASFGSMMNAMDRNGRPVSVGAFVKDDRGRVYRFGGFDGEGFAVGLRWVASRGAFASAQACAMTPLRFCELVDSPLGA